ncbi:MAG: type IV secretory system conjugative DNA transfer family protein [Lachnospiraceae bacterium]|nr:type IV secretory system conjugative DNA transfer family protein [Lachnospiraceae bacterium]
MIPQNTLVLADNCYYSMDSFETQLNNNVLVVGSSGCGKTRSIVSPNILQASGSYIISDPKGVLYPKYRKYLEEHGYEVQVLDFIHPEKSTRYNFFRYIRSTRDIIKIAHMLVYGMGDDNGKKPDPFWDEAAELLLTSIIAFLHQRGIEEDKNLSAIQSLIMACQVDEDHSSGKTTLDIIMEREFEDDEDNFAYRQYQKFRIAAGKTLKSIMITLNAHLGKYDFEELNRMMEYDETNIASIGQKKKALFVIVSDTDRSMDGLANLFYSQAMNELCRYADEECKGNRLPVDVRFILDDFATNCRIADFPTMISNIRSRGISAMLMIQAESQLEHGYGANARTIIANCDTYVYLGGNDVDTAKKVAERCDLPYRKILNMPIGTNWIFRRGQEPINGKNLVLEKFTGAYITSKEGMAR